MKNAIIYIALLLISTNATSQISIVDTIQLPCANCYSRALLNLEHSVVIGTSNAGVYLLNKKTEKLEQIILPIKDIEFRDLASIGDDIYAMGSGDDGIIIRYSKQSGCDTFVYEKGVFFDDLTVYKKQIIVLGDPVGQQFFLKVYDKKGKESMTLPPLQALADEACYAASGTTAAIYKDNYYFISGGGKSSRIHSLPLISKQARWISEILPLNSGSGAGPFSMQIETNGGINIVGGNYTTPMDNSSTGCHKPELYGKWLTYATPPFGYRSCIHGAKNYLLTCGTNGMEYKTLRGEEWRHILDGNFCALEYLSNKGTWLVSTNKNYLIQCKIE